MSLASSTFPSVDVAARAASLATLGRAEATVALLAQQVDEQQTHVEAARRDAEAAQQAAFERQIDHLASEASSRLLGGVLAGALEATAGVAQFAEAAGQAAGRAKAEHLVASAGRPSSPSVDCLPKALRAVDEGVATASRALTLTASSAGAARRGVEAALAFDADGSARDARRAEAAAGRAGRAAEDHREACTRIQGFEDKALRHLEEIARARAEAALIAARG